MEESEGGTMRKARPQWGELQKVDVLTENEFPELSPEDRELFVPFSPENERKRAHGRGSVYLRKGSNVYLMQYRHNGRVIRQSTGQTSLKLATQKLDDTLAHIRGRSNRPDAWARHCGSAG